MRTLVQKVSGGHFLARGRIHGLVNAPGMGVGARPFGLQQSQKRYSLIYATTAASTKRCCGSLFDTSEFCEPVTLASPSGRGGPAAAGTERASCRFDPLSHCLWRCQLSQRESRGGLSKQEKDVKYYLKTAAVSGMITKTTQILQISVIPNTPKGANLNHAISCPFGQSERKRKENKYV